MNIVTAVQLEQDTFLLSRKDLEALVKAARESDNLAAKVELIESAAKEARYQVFNIGDLKAAKDLITYIEGFKSHV